MITAKQVRELSERLGVSIGVCKELLLLSGGDMDLAERCSLREQGLNQCKARIINERFKKLEQ